MNQDDTTQTRSQLSAEWQKAALDLLREGIPGRIVFDTLMTVGLAGRIELEGKRATAEALLAIVRKLSDEVHEEEKAIAEAEQATKKTDQEACKAFYETAEEDGIASFLDTPGEPLH